MDNGNVVRFELRRSDRLRKERAARAIELKAICEGVRSHRLTLEDRIRLARNLGRILEPQRGKRGALSGLLASAGLAQEGDYSKHQHRYILFEDPGRDEGIELAARLDPYLRIGREAARLGLVEGISPDGDEYLLELLRGCSFAGDGLALPLPLAPDLREVAASFEPLKDMLAALAESVRDRFDLPAHCRRIARRRLISGNGGGQISAEDHPVGPAPAELDFWIDRIDLLPLVPLFPVIEPSLVGPADLRFPKSDALRKASLQQQGCVWFGLWPFGAELRIEPVFLRYPMYWLDLPAQGGPGEEMGLNVFELPIGTPILAGETQAIWAWDRRNQSALTLDLVPAPAACEVGQTLVAELRPERLSLASLYAVVEGDLSRDAKDIAREWLGVDFLGAAEAYPQTLAAFLERGLRYADPADPSRLDNRLRAVAQLLATAVCNVEDEIKTMLAAGLRSFLMTQRQRATE